MRQSEQVNEIAGALAKAQGEMQHASLDGVNPHFRSKYATLAAVCNACKSVLSAHGIAFIQHSHECETGVKIETVFYHSSGQFISAGIVFVPADKFNAHGLGSAMTYARRYALSMACGIASEEDDDGNAAVANAPKRGTRTVDAALEGVDVDWTKVGEYKAGIEAAIFNEDEGGLRELMDELGTDNDLKLAVWSKLDSKQRKHIKDLKKSVEAA